MVQKSVPKRGRPRAYDPDKALRNARDVFWERGFSATSLDDIGAATGMNRPSLYAAFGGKHALYMKAFDAYRQTSRRMIDVVLAPDIPLSEGLHRFYTEALDTYVPKQGKARGCFMIATGVTEAAQDADVRKALGDALHDIEKALEARFTAAKKAGEISTGTNPRALAMMASAALYSMAIQSRTGAPRKALQAIADAAIETLCAGGSKSRTRITKP